MGSYYVDMQHDNVDMQLTYVTLRLFFMSACYMYISVILSLLCCIINNQIACLHDLYCIEGVKISSNHLLTPVIITVTKHARCNESMLACKIIMPTCDLMSEYGINMLTCDLFKRNVQVCKQQVQISHMST